VEDARLAADSGADALVVSNHGGRQLDGAPSSISQLPAIVDAVGTHRSVARRRYPFRPGRAQGHGAGRQRHLIGRPHLYGGAGRGGVTKALDIIARELDVSMALCGYNDIRDVNREILLPGTFPENVF
jgi:L-lactate dehydrogenase (cytochrome)